MGASSAQTLEAICGTTPTRLDPTPLAARQGIAITNNGPHTIGIYVSNLASPSFTIGQCEILLPNEDWGPFILDASCHVFGITSVLQVTGAATVTMEYGG